MAAILAIDTSTLTASVAVVVDGDVSCSRESGVNTHSQEIIPLIDQALDVAGVGLPDLSYIAIGAGPGSFTGLRIGMATAKGLCYAASVPLLPVSSLAALGHDILASAAESREDLIAPIMDARRGEVFVGIFQRDGQSLKAVCDEVVLPPSDAAQHIASVAATRTLLVGGDGWAKYHDKLADIGTSAEGARITPSAAGVARAAAHLAPDQSWQLSGPSYVRLAEAEIKFPDGNSGGTFRPD